MTYIFVIIGASGIGKTTLAKAVVRSSDTLVMPVGVTTRPPRKGEKNGVDYRFIRPQTFQQWQREACFIESIEHQSYHYGFLKRDILDPMDKGLDLLIILTAEGLSVFETMFGKKVTSIFIAPPSSSELKRRRKKRGNWKVLTPEDDIFGMNRSYHFKIVNDKLKSTVGQICLIRDIVKKKKGEKI